MDIKLDKKPFNGYIKFSLQFLYCGNICFQDTYIPICEIDIAVKLCYQKEDFNVCWKSCIDFLTMSIFCHLYFQSLRFNENRVYKLIMYLLVYMYICRLRGQIRVPKPILDCFLSCTGLVEFEFSMVPNRCKKISSKAGRTFL